MTTSLYVFAGQSNAQRWGNANSLPNAAQDAQVDVEILNAALGGTGTTASTERLDWFPYEDGRADTGELLTALFVDIDAHLAAHPETQLDTIIWAQGEFEARWFGDHGSYLARLEEIYDQLRAAYGADFRFVIPPMTEFAPVIGFNALANWTAVQRVQEAFAFLHPEVQILDIVAITSDAGLGTADIYRDAVHYNYPALDALSAEVLQPWTAPAPYVGAIKGSGQADTLSGTAGNDMIFGNKGADLLNGAGGDDTLSGGRQNDTVNGKAGADLLLGQHGNDLLQGGKGDDALFGGDGADTLMGNKGNDSIFAGDGGDVVLGGNGADAAFGGDGADLIEGGRGNDTVAGAGGADTVLGGVGDDTLLGGGGENDLTGGEGADVFIFSLNQLDEISHILDFETGIDRVEVFESASATVSIGPSGEPGQTQVDVGDLTFFVENGAVIDISDIFLV